MDDIFAQGGKAMTVFLGLGIDGAYLLRWASERAGFGGSTYPSYVEVSNGYFLGLRSAEWLGYVSFVGSYFPYDPSSISLNTTSGVRSFRLMVGRPIRNYDVLAGLSLEKPTFFIGDTRLSGYNHQIFRDAYPGFRAEVSRPIVWKVLFLSPRVGLVYLPVARWYGAKDTNGSLEIYEVASRRNVLRLYMRLHVGVVFPGG